MKYLLFILLSLLISCHNHKPQPITQSKNKDSRIFCVYAPSWSGTGFDVIAPSGKIYTITNRHVCEKESYLTATGKDVRVVIRVYEKADLCILTSPDKTGFTVASSYKFGQRVKVTGYPHRVRTTLYGNLYGTGRAMVGETEDLYLVFLNLPSRPGSSGSPVLDMNGQVIGVINAGNGQNTSLAVPLEFLQEMLRGL